MSLVKIQSVVIDDEVNNAQVLINLLHKYCPNIDIIGSANTYEDAKMLLLTTNPQIIFLDIKLDTGTAFDLLKEVPNQKAKIVFTTAYQNYSLEAFKYNAVDYLLKPISIEDLIVTVNKINDDIKNYIFTFKEQIDNLNLIFSEKKSPERILIQSIKKIDFLKVAEINYVKSEGKYSIFFMDNQDVVSTKNLGYYEDLLPVNSFFRVHNSYLINLKKINYIQKEGATACIMNNEKEVPISSRKYQHLLRKISEL